VNALSKLSAEEKAEIAKRKAEEEYKRI
jgi:hypothetical protein